MERALKFDHLPETLKDKVVNMLSKHDYMWAGRLGEISITKHRIELQKDAKLIYQALTELDLKLEKWKE
jgi:hypothetical protein